MGNQIGTDITGTLTLANHLDGVLIEHGAGNTIGGTVTGDANLISGNYGAGVNISGGDTTGNLVEGNMIGLDATGAVALGNSVSGVVVASSSGDTIGGTAGGARNVISGNFPANVYLEDATDVLVAGDFIGTDARGTGAVYNDSYGVSISGGSDITIGGSGTLARDVISGNDHAGIILGGGVTSSVIEGDYIGVDQTGTQPVPNDSGIVVDSAGNTIGGTAHGDGNVISANLGPGISIVSVGAPGTTVEGNFIGTDESGTLPLGNSTDGVELQEATDVTIGGTAAGAGNVISSNAGAGIALVDDDTDDLVQANFIGTDVTVAVPLGNGTGVLIEAGLDGTSSDNTIGGTAAGAGNTIANNDAVGVGVASTTAVGNTIRDNAMFGDDGPGIVLASGAVDAPVIDSLTTSGGTTTVGGSLVGSPDVTYALDFYSMTSFVSRSYGEGRYLLGSGSVTTDGSGDASFSFSFPTPSQGATFVTATATDTTTGDPQLGTTSSFAYDYGSDTPPAAVIGFTLLTVNEGTPVHFSGQGSTDPGGEPLTYSWSFGDGGTATGSSTIYIYRATGTYTVTLTVTDGFGGSNQATGTMDVVDVPPGFVPQAYEAPLTFTPAASGTGFGTSIATVQGNVAVGAPQGDGGDGAVYLYDGVPNDDAELNDIQLRPVDGHHRRSGRHARRRLRRLGRGDRQRPDRRCALRRRGRGGGVPLRRRSPQPDLRATTGDLRQSHRGALRSVRGRGGLRRHEHRDRGALRQRWEGRCLGLRGRLDAARLRRPLVRPRRPGRRLWRRVRGGAGVRHGTLGARRRADRRGDGRVGLGHLKRRRLPVQRRRRLCIRAVRVHPQPRREPWLRLVGRGRRLGRGDRVAAGSRRRRRGVPVRPVGRPARDLRPAGRRRRVRHLGRGQRRRGLDRRAGRLDGCRGRRGRLPLQRRPAGRVDYAVHPATHRRRAGADAGHGRRLRRGGRLHRGQRRPDGRRRGGATGFADLYAPASP